MQFFTGIFLFVGLTWFQVFNTPSSRTSPLYMAALAFTAFGIHWLAMAHRRYIGASDLPDAWMAIAFALLSLLGIVVFFTAGDVPLGILFIGLFLIYATESPRASASSQQVRASLVCGKYIHQQKRENATS